MNRVFIWFGHLHGQSNTYFSNWIDEARLGERRNMKYFLKSRLRSKLLYWSSINYSKIEPNCHHKLDKLSTITIDEIIKYVWKRRIEIGFLIVNRFYGNIKQWIIRIIRYRYEIGWPQSLLSWIIIHFSLLKNTILSNCSH